MISRIYLAGSMVCALLAAPAQAQEGASVPVGNMQLYPWVSVGVGHNDNLTLLPTREFESSFVRVAPGLLLEGEGDKSRVQLGYEGDWVWYDDFSRQDFDDHRLFGIAGLKISSRWLVTGELDFRKDHDESGSTDRQRSLEPDKWKSWGASGKVRYGADGAKGRAELFGGYIDKDYTNNRAVTSTYDKNEGTARGTFFWRVGGRTDALAELIYKDIDYKLSTSLQDNTLTTINGGIEWEATGKTTGKLRLGYTEKDFRSSLIPDTDIFSWNVGVTWKPRTYSKVDFTTRRTVEDSTGQGTSIVRTGAVVDWKHAWRERFSTTLTGGLENNDYESSNREDDYVLLGVRGDYQFRRWMSFGAYYRYRDNDSNQDISDYTQNIFMLEVKATL